MCKFHLRYHKNINDSTKIGEIKILQHDKYTTILPDEFSHLDEKYISIGQELDFYSTLVNTVGSETTKDVLEALNDVS